MANVRAINKNKFNISNYRFRELYYFCLQYTEWKAALKEKHDTLLSTDFSGIPSSGLPGNPTEKIALQCAELAQKCNAVESAAMAADPELYKYIIYAVTCENVTFNHLKMQMAIPCERDRYYNSRRKFYFLLDKILRNKTIEI